MSRRLPLVLLLALSPVPARAEALVICHIGGPGSTDQARPVVEKFLRHVELAGGLAKGSMTGEYHTTAAGCLGYIKATQPLFGVFDLPTYLSQGKALKLRPLAHMGDQRYHVLVREGTFKDLAALKGKTIYVTIDDAKFLSSIVLDGKLDLAQLKLKPTGRPLKGLRKVARGQADAALVDAAAFKHLDELKLPAKLVSIFGSKDLPGLTLAVLGTAKASPVAVKKVTAALPKLCAGEGAKLCKTVGVTAFTKVKPATYARLLKKYQ